ncbi:GNAT family N-acetyltransferase [Sphingobacterium psychroaquaticum]|uniref:Acetyltransferase (GNAT) family protein n=1 Tax=Sphingobacterium psychroaquaticum TaxID=561061 RepID=A0A1X7KE29_9SPHI|nr:GNAT family N-acetyltransferase [Sphingobacterium psychroaquaticum]SMG39119.1 Acetyltransferase (GNAT) family protein [Sphingobacterium psychroaquaticum]
MNMEQHIITLVEERHKDEILSYVIAFRKKLFPMLDSDKIPDDLRFFEETYITHPYGAFLQARTKSGKLVGVIGMMAYDFRFPHLPLDQRPTVEVARLFIEPDVRRSGLGTTLFQALLRCARERSIERLYLHTHPFLTGAYEFWLKQDFSLVDFCEEGGFSTIHMERQVLQIDDNKISRKNPSANSLLQTTEQ